MVTEMSEITSVGCLMKEFNLLRVQRDEFDSGTESDKDLSATDDYRLRSNTYFKAADCSSGDQTDTCNTRGDPNNTRGDPNTSAKQTFQTSSIGCFPQQCEKDSESDNDWELEEIFTKGCDKVQQQQQQQQTTLRQCASSGRWHADSVDEGFLEDCPEPVQFSSAPPEGLSHCNTLSPQAFLAYSDMDFEYCDHHHQQLQQ